MKPYRSLLVLCCVAASSCGGGKGASAEDHARAACSSRAEVAEGASKAIATGSQELAAKLKKAEANALTEARAAAAKDHKYDAFAKGIEAEQDSLSPESTRQLEANTARREVIDPTCRSFDK